MTDGGYSLTPAAGISAAAFHMPHGSLHWHPSTMRTATKPKKCAHFFYRNLKLKWSTNGTWADFVEPQVSAS